VQHGYVIIPKSVTEHRIRENIDIFDFDLTAAEISTISGLERELRTSGDPATFDFAQG
jgi:diketogulonate reductase-like aldo/keto reductase